MARPKLKAAPGEVVHIGGDVPTNGGDFFIGLENPYTVNVRLEGTADMLFHAWNPEAVKEKAEAKKGSAGKKTDNVESYVYRDDKGYICLPGEYFRQSIINAAKYRQDPRSPRKSAMDLYKAGIVVPTMLAPLNGGVKDWDYLCTKRVVVQRNGVNRVRPAFKVGWSAEFSITVLLPEYIGEHDLRATIDNAGRLIGVADFRPSYGRFVVTKWKIVEA